MGAGRSTHPTVVELGAVEAVGGAKLFDLGQDQLLLSEAKIELVGRSELAVVEQRPDDLTEIPLQLLQSLTLTVGSRNAGNVTDVKPRLGTLLKHDRGLSHPHPCCEICRRSNSFSNAIPTWAVASSRMSMSSIGEGFSPLSV